ncbi:tetratricopeptide repeat protein [Leucobacter zeae]|nr:tetratricopeptide repeat protein [Leucobacter zeae]
MADESEFDAAVDAEGGERALLDRDRTLAWELYDADPEHPRIAALAGSVLERAPEMTGMVILTALHREALGEVAEARRLLQELVGRRDRQYVNALKHLRDLEYSDRNYAEALRLSEIVLREQPDAGWIEWMELGSATVFVRSPEAGWRIIDEAVERCARTDPDAYADALGQRALRFLATGAPPERFGPAAEEAIAADPAELVLTVSLGFAYLFDYRAEEAEDLFLRVLRETPTDGIAQAGLRVSRGFLEPLRNGTHTMDDHRAAGSGELAWRMMCDYMFDTTLAQALAALDAVMPADLEASLRAPLSEDAALSADGDADLLSWHDGQSRTGAGLWGMGETFRLLSGAEVSALEAAIERDPDAYPEWGGDDAYFSIIATDDDGTAYFTGVARRLYARRAGIEDRLIAPSLADWAWDRAVGFGWPDPRPGRA